MRGAAANCSSPAVNRAGTPQNPKLGKDVRFESEYRR